MRSKRRLAYQQLSARTVFATDILAISPDTGTAANDFITNQISFGISGVAEPGSEVQLLQADLVIASTTTGEDGSWSIAELPGIAEGVAELIAQSIDPTGQVVSTSAPRIIEVDLTAPSIPSGLNIARIKNEEGIYDFQISGQAELRSTIEIHQVGGEITDSAVTDESGQFIASSNHTSLIDRSFSFEAVAIDTAGNVSESSPPVSFRPNIVLVNTDDMRFDDVARLPFLNNEVVPESTVFTNSFVPTALSGPSRASLLTGLYAHRTGILGNAAPLGGGVNLTAESTLPERLQTLGYQTGLFGKDRTFVNEDESNGEDTLNATPGWSDYFANIAGGNLGYGTAFADNGIRVDFGPDTYLTDLIFAESNDFISRSAASGQPFFSYIAPLTPHAPGVGELKDQWSINEDLPRPPSFNIPEVGKSAFTQDFLETIKQYRQGGLESLISIDEGVQSLFSHLSQASLLDNTVFVFTSDNGMLYAEHGRFSKNAFYEESIRVPLVVWDGREKVARSTDSIALNVDLLPTFVHLAGDNATPDIDGRSLVPILINNSVSVRNNFLIHHTNTAETPTVTEKAVRGLQYSYAVRSDGGEFLFDLTADPYQLTNLANNPDWDFVLQSQRVLLTELEATDHIGPLVESATMSATGSDVMIPQQLKVTASITDIERGDSPLRTPELVYTANTALGTGIALTAIDGKFESPAELTSLNLPWKDIAERGAPAAVILRGRDIIGNWSDNTTVPLDLLPPPILNEDSDTGIVNTDKVTLDSTPTFHGQASPFADVALFVASERDENFSLAGATQADEYGNWSLTLALPIAGRWFVYGQIKEFGSTDLHFLAPTIMYLAAMGLPNLIINGTPASERIEVFETTSGVVEIRYNGVSAGLINGVTSVTMNGLTGNDHLAFLGSLPVGLYGGDGHDTLTGGSGSDVLNGGRGNNILIGGLGADRYIFLNELAPTTQPRRPIDTINDPLGPGDSIDFRVSRSVELNGAIANSGAYAKYSTLYRTTREVRLGTGTSPAKFGRVTTGSSADVIETGLSTIVTAGPGNDFVKIIEPVEIGRNILIRAFSLGLVSDAGETFTTTLSSTAGSLTVRTDLPNAPQVVGNNTNQITLIGSDKAIASVFNAGVRFVAVGTPVGDATIEMATQSNQNSAKSENDETQVRIVSTPVIAGISGAIQFVENGAPLLISATAQVKDMDADTNGSTLKVWNSGFTDPADAITIVSQTAAGQVSVSGSTIIFGNLVIGTFSGSGMSSNPLQVSFNANATMLGIQAVMRRIAFQNRSDNPSSVPRSVSFQFVDAAGNRSTTLAKSVNVLPVNDAPKLFLSGVVSASQASTAYVFVGGGAAY